MLNALHAALGMIFLAAGYLIGLSRHRDFMDQIATLRHRIAFYEQKLDETGRERDEATDYAHRLLESPTFWREQRSIARAVAGSPDFGVFGRIVDHAREN